MNNNNEAINQTFVSKAHEFYESMYKIDSELCIHVIKAIGAKYNIDNNLVNKVIAELR